MRNPAVGITGQVDQHGAAGWPLKEPVQRYDRERLLNRPMIEHGLKDRKIDQVLVDQQVLQFEEFPRQRIGLFRPQLSQQG